MSKSPEKVNSVKADQKEKAKPTKPKPASKSASAKPKSAASKSKTSFGTGGEKPKKAGAKPKTGTKAATTKPKTGGYSGKKSGTKATSPAKKATAKRTTRASSAGRNASRKPSANGKSASKAGANPVAAAANRRSGERRRRPATDDLFMEKATAAPKKPASGGRPPHGDRALFGVLNACLVIAIVVLAGLGARQQAAYADFLRMREVVDRQTFYDGTTVEGVDVSNMTLSNALDYWRERVEARNADRAAVLDNGVTVTARELGYESDYESVLSAAWSAGRSGSLEERYRMASSRRSDPVAYDITRTDTREELVDQFVQTVAVQVDQPALDAEVEDFDPETYEFTFTESQVGRKLDADALKRSIVAAIAAGGGNVTLEVEETPPTVTTAEASQKYGLIDYAITNASSSSKARLNNIKLAMSIINGKRVAPGETFSFNDTVGQRTSARGFKKATAYSGGEVTEEIGGGICQVSTTLFNAAVKADMQIDERHNHSLTVAYVDKGKDATVDWGHQDLKFTNTSEDDVFICCYLTDDKRVRFGIFGRLLPNGEKITVEAETTEVIKYETEYQATPLLAPGATSVQQNGRNGYKAEAYKIRWDAQGNQLSRELLCKSIYKVKNEIVLYGA